MALVAGLAVAIVFVVVFAPAEDEPRLTGGDAVANVGSDEAEGANRPKVEVLNGSGRQGAAREVADLLRGGLFDIVQVGNADHFEHERTHVLDRSGRMQVATLVAEAMDVDSVAAQVNPDLYLDVTVVIGKDWEGPGDR